MPSWKIDIVQNPGEIDRFLAYYLLCLVLTKDGMFQSTAHLFIIHSTDILCIYYMF